jgi:hemerythrin-like domain-containing protein
MSTRLNKNPTDILREEHEKVLRVLDKLEKDLEDKDIELSGEDLTTLEEEFDKHSLNKEEKALFPQIEKFIPREDGPTGMMIIEHQDVVQSIKNCREAIKNGNFEKLNESGSHIVDLLRQHIDKENNILFMIADMHLDESQRRTILEKFEEIDSGMMLK